MFQARKESTIYHCRMDKKWAARVVCIIACVILTGRGAPTLPNPDTLVESGESEIPNPLMDDGFYEEFPEVVNPSAKSKYFIHKEDMVFIKSKEDNTTRSKRNAVFYVEDLWPNARIPYEIAPTFDNYERRVIFQGMAHWEEHTCVRFYPKQSTDRYSIYINNQQAHDCSSYVGRILFRFQRKQGLSLGAGCVYFSTVVHEFGHALGLYHEHNRADRDSYVTVNPNLHFYPRQVEKQFRSNTLGKGYDYASIMHYSSLRGTIVSKIRASFGSAEELSPLDIAKVNLLYRCGDCKNRPPLSTTVPSLGLPDNTRCGGVIRTSRSGSFTFQSNHQPNQKCNYVLALPEGYSVEYRVTLLGSDLDGGNCANSYIAFYEGATVAQHRIYNYSPKPRFCSRRDFFYSFILPNNVTTISYQASSSRPQPVRVNYYVRDQNECQRARDCARCVNTAGSYECVCRPGFYLSRPAKTCYDVNECAENNGGCAHTCTNSAGSYTCSCRSGYFLQADGKSCRRNRPIGSPWPLTPGSINTNTCPVTFVIPNQPPVVTTPRPTTLPPTTPPPTTPSPTTPPPTTPSPTTPSPTTPPPTTSLPTTPAPITSVLDVVSSTMNGYNTHFSTPGWPLEPYPLNTNFEWNLLCPTGAEFIDIKFEDNFKVAGKMPLCPRDKVYIYSNGKKVAGPFCHLTAPEQIDSLSGVGTKVMFISGFKRGIARTGFSVRFQCRGTPATTVPLTTAVPTTPEPTTPESTTPEPTTPEPTTPEPTTPEPTTPEPTTPEPTTPEPTTPEPTTPEPTTQPTTHEATTPELTTEELTIADPTTTSPVSVGPCGPEVVTATTRNEYTPLFSTPGWPEVAYPLNVTCEWNLRCPSPTDQIDMKFEEFFSVAGRMPECPKDKIYVYSRGVQVAGPLCHLTAPEPIESLDAGNARIVFHSGDRRGIKRTGFAVRFKCRATPTTAPPIFASTTPEPTTPKPTTPRPTTFKPTTPKPTTPESTTFKPTTPKPTTPEPTTFKPTTPEPTTFKPTTPEPTTFKPTTFKPTTPEPTTFKPTTPKPTTPESTTFKPTTPEPTTFKPTTPKPTTPEQTTPEPTTHTLTTPEPTTPEPTTPEPTTLKPTTPEPTTPKSTTPEPTTPKPTTPEPTTPEPTTPEPTTPEPTTPEPTTPEPTTPKPTIPKPTSSEPTTQSSTPPLPPTTINPVMSTACGGVIRAPSTYQYVAFSTPGWPTTPYPLNTVCDWVLTCPPGSRYIDLKFEESFKIAGKMPSCPKDKVFVETSFTTKGPFCHLTRPDPITFLDARNTRVKLHSGNGRGISRTGLGAQFQCR